jgi:hypothetical protein
VNSRPFSDRDFRAFVLYAHRELKLDLSAAISNRSSSWERRSRAIDALRRGNLTTLLRETTHDADAGWERDANWTPRPYDD